VIVTTVWKQNVKNGFPIESADGSATGLTDITHSAGAARIGALFALGAVWLSIAADVFDPECQSNEVWALILGVFLVVPHHCNYLRIGKSAEGFINEVLSDTLMGKT
jgi:hypothetical protein